VESPSDASGTWLKEARSDTGARITGGTSSSTSSGGGGSSSSGEPSPRQAGCIHDTAIDGVTQPVLQWVSALIDICPNSILAGGKAAPVVAEAALTAAEYLDHLLHPPQQR